MNALKKFLFSNADTKQTVAKNTIWLFLGEILGRVLKLGVIVYATRLLGAEGWGTFSYVLAFVSLFYAFTDIGISTFITRELSKESEDSYSYIFTAFILKSALLLFSLLISVIFIPQFAKIHIDVSLILMLALLNFSDALREFILSINRSFERMEREAFIKIVLNVFTTTLGLLLVFLYKNVFALALAYTLGSVIATALSFIVVRPIFKKVTWLYSFEKVKVILNFSWPYIATTFFTTAIFNIDSIMLGQIKSASDVGIYSAALRIFHFITLIPIYIGIALFPIMSKHEADNSYSTSIFESSMIMLFAIGIPIIIGGSMLSTSIMTTIFGQAFVTGGIVLSILLIAILADFPNTILSNVIVAKNIQRKFIVSTGIGLVLNVVLNIVLIPDFAVIGAAIATVLSRLLIMVLNWHLLKRHLSFSVVPKLGKIVIASIVLAFVIFILSSIGVNFLFIIPLAVAVYAFTLYILKEETLIKVLAIIKPS
jgi:O-antigen/teichoic acid export membrane protein